MNGRGREKGNGREDGEGKGEKGSLAEEKGWVGEFASWLLGGWTAPVTHKALFAIVNGSNNIQEKQLN